jgi:hypothetical protein
MSSAQNATPRVYVDIYPYEGGKYSLSGNDAGVLSCVTHKDIRETGPGTFRLKLAPGGPDGPNFGPSWTEIITPMSLVVIGMARYDHKQITMIGIVGDPVETQDWQTGKGVTRVISISGYDFQYFFATGSYYTLSLLGATDGAMFGSVGLPQSINTALLAGTPASVGAAWFNTIMAGAKGVLAQTNFQYQNASVRFPDLMATLFEEYPSKSGVTIPLGNYFMTMNGTWISKFLELFPFPWYEMFVITAPVGYGPYSDNAFSTAAIPISMDMKDGTGFLSASPTVVARVNPLPYTSGYTNASVQVSLGGSTANPSTTANGVFTMDKTRWQNDLQRYTLENKGFIESSVGFNINEVRNFYIVNPTWFTQMFGVSNNNMNSFIYTFASWIDTASIHRYGYRPQNSQIQWFSDPSGIAAQTNSSKQQGFQQLVQELALRQTSYFEPTPNMANGSVTFELRPDIIPGNVFTYEPFKNKTKNTSKEWDFYITGVTHTYVFGGQSQTTLSLSRGLPKSVYDDPTLLAQLHSGAAMRKDGEYVAGIPGEANQVGLQPISIGTTSMKQILGQVAGVFVQPMGGQGQ